MKKGKIILVGAGTGSLKLLTLGGKEAILQADVVLYDRLVSDEILQLIPDTAMKINVGKSTSNHTIPQDEINKIMFEKAQEGNTVVRLKGGDPFVFGRGGEELILPAKHDIPFEVISGVTSAIAVPAYAGIPVTHRDFSSSFHVITGHSKNDNVLDIDFEALVRTKGTLIFLMGVSSLSTIMDGLQENGMSPNMPACIVENGTTTKQRCILATVETLTTKARENKVKSPSVIIVGEVCSLAESLSWVDKLPLYGKKILLTRPVNRIGTLRNSLHDLGAEVLEYPCIATEPISSSLPDIIAKLSEIEWLCFTSPYGVEIFFDALNNRNLDARALATVKLAVVGSATKKSLAQHGLKADFMPDTFDVEHLGKGLAEIATGKVIILRAEEGASDLVDIFSQKNIDYEDIAIYKTFYEHPESEELREQIPNLKYATFTSASTIKGFVNLVGTDVSICHITAFCIGKQTAKEAEKYGMNIEIAQESTLNSLLELISEKLGE